jgi:histidinol-phosphate aminotransferase
VTAAPPLRADLAGLAPYGAPQLDVAIRLNTNENPYPPSDGLARAIAEAAGLAAARLNRYPDRDATALRADLAAYLGLLQAFGGPGRTATGFEPSYSMHALIARITSTGWIPAARDADFGLDPGRAASLVHREQPDVVFLTSPNNPTGTALPLDVIEAVCGVAPGMVVVDEAYAEFARPGTPSALELLPRFPRLAVTRTMSKAFALAGARVGYLAAAPEVISSLLVVRLPHHLSAVTRAATRAALARSGELLAAVDTLRAERDAAVGWLRGTGLTAADSDANFVLFGEFGDRHAVWQGLLDRGVLIRETGPPGWLRVSIGTPQEMAGFRAALSAVLGLPGTAVTDDGEAGAA